MEILLEEGEIAARISLEDAARWIVEEALGAGASDNCTAIVSRLEPD